MLRFFSLIFLFFASAGFADTIYLRDNLKNARPGDFIVAIQNKSYTLLHIYNRNANFLVIEEVTIPAARINLKTTSWREWIFKGAPGNTSWIVYNIDLDRAKPQKYYSLTKNSWFEMPERENFLATLLNLRLEKLSAKERKKIGVPVIPSAETKHLWNPKLIVDGNEIVGAVFDAWRTRWPEDGSDIAGKTIEVYTPQNPLYPSYFPYWLQISGAVGCAKVRIIDSGNGLLSPAPVIFDLFEGQS